MTPSRAPRQSQSCSCHLLQYVSRHFRQATIQRPRSKSRTIIRMLTTKFSPRSTSTSPSRQVVRPPPTIPNAFGKDQRDAALRARGLLPPLPNKDLSTQEMEQDQFIPVVTSFDESERPHDANPSAADLIKKEWVSKNHNVERERMNSFKFGGGVSPVSGSFVADLSTPPAANQLAEDPTNADPVSPPPMEALPPLPTSPSPDSSDPMPLRVDVPTEMEPYMFPLPPSRSPSPSSMKGAFSFPPASSTIPASPSLRSIPDTPYSLHTTVGAGSGTNTPRPPDTQRETTPVPLPAPSSAPAISLTPPTDFIPPSFEESSTSADDSIISAFHKRTDSFAQLEESISSSSATVPSLDASNSTATTDSVESSNVNANAAAAITTPTTTPQSSTAPIAKGKLGGLTVRTNDAPVIPVIVESPLADGFSNELEVVVEEPLSMLINETDVKEADEDHDDHDEKPAMTPLLTSPQSPRSPGIAVVSPGVASPQKKRGLTDPSSADRRKSLSLNPFKRGATFDHGSSNGDELKPPLSPTTTASRRLSVAASFSNIRRSVAGTLSSRKGATASSGGDARGRKFDASHLPPSPTLPSSFRSAGMGLRGNGVGTTPTPPVPTSPRMAVSPVLYSRGSILLETSNIEDEETRLRTEMAFLG
ncbi:hypothetical protein M413DRAFT_163995 [Hebeloma cylindrosporum]|uniref:Uncharacterized protein n=1 Tax=Hebeloma cylindrosporum TaxID=76867 RepID=A0A0C2YHL8_HEBCY|nr:hypothetical protein M413DRAFT_163995 [Hebeloma cylindrosporum h7]